MSTLTAACSRLLSELLGELADDDRCDKADRHWIRQVRRLNDHLAAEDAVELAATPTTCPHCGRDVDAARCPNHLPLRHLEQAS